ncbi:hypothetical protein COU20_02155 [Candidatus Kaiserbacteria bacterium CG10_big_fil_rev_8_21_14_0_10_59_10]|uniref:Uncharacterized protein n=1 Tax=Candidatus Kaiserbacteria bacterium CG10_big_fil_rev_8_21_14_0_10_59_10 TaxID=1974612 RepID=A0A2H0U7V2_9BACT|nr:MAG: hypothetical protein COU20_02155 [Candidatus Kaiserbacteria bacterium CG10_big_fil_rev_8_21_14_0_10_59_10]
MDEDRMLEETYRLSKENNRMLHAMRRSAFIGGVVKLMVWIVLLVVLPLWLYSTYLAPVLEQMRETMDQVQGANASVQAQFGALQGLADRFDPREYFKQN